MGMFFLPIQAKRFRIECGWRKKGKKKKPLSPNDSITFLFDMFIFFFQLIQREQHIEYS